MSGNVVPASGNIQFLSNTPATAVCQVFGLATSNVPVTTLVGRPYNSSITNPPVFTAPTVPPLPVRVRTPAGASLFLPSPTSAVIRFYDNSIQFQPTLSPTEGVNEKYYIALGTSPGTSNIVNWTQVSNNTLNTVSGWSLNTLYYISTFLSNTVNGRKSLAISNSSPFGIPNFPTVTFSITSTSNWTISWNPNSAVIVPTSYHWYLYNVTNGTVVASNLSVASNVSNVTGTTALSYNINYAAIVSSLYTTGTTTSSSARQSTTRQVPALAAPTHANFTNLPTRDVQTVTANWGAVTNASGYRLTMNDVFVTDVTGTSYSIPLTTWRSYARIFKVQSKDGAHLGGISSGIQFFYQNDGLNFWQTVTFTSNANYIMRVIGGNGGAASSAPDGTYYTTGGPGPAGCTTAITYSPRTHFQYILAISASGRFPGYPGPGGSPAVFNTLVGGGAGGGWSAIYFPEVAAYVVIAAGGGGEGGGGINLGIGATPQIKVGMIQGKGGRGGYEGSDERGANGRGVSPEFLKVINGQIAPESLEGEGGTGSRGGGVWTSNVGGFVYTTGSPYYGNAEYTFPNSFKPTAGAQYVGGNGGKVAWFAGCCGGGGGAGFYGGAGGSAYSMVMWGDVNDSTVHKSAVVGGGGGGGSGYIHPSYAYITTNTSTTYNSENGCIFLGQIV
jgi:hypothetical protein